MQSKTLAQLLTPRSAAAVLSALAATATLAIAMPSQAQDVTAVSVSPQAPTSITLRVAGLEIGAVKQQVRKAAHQVCRNAAVNGELDVFDVAWCTNASRLKAMNVYRSALKGADMDGVRQAQAPYIRVAASGV